MKLLVTGGCGFVGSNLTAAAMRRGQQPVVYDDLSRVGSDSNRRWLSLQGVYRFVQGDVRDADAVRRVIDDVRPNAVFHLAGQVAMTTSLADPRRDFEVNAGGTLNVLEAVRQLVPDCLVVYSSTNKVYGNLEQYSYREEATRYRCVERPFGFDESTPLEFHSPYGCSKGAADQYVLDYARMFGVRTVVLRHSSMYGGRQFSTVDQGWVGWFVSEALRVAGGDREPVRIAGNGKQVRDVLAVEDVVELYFRICDRRNSLQGEAFNIGGGIESSMSILELVLMLEELVGVRIPVESGPPRESDQRVFVADIAKARRMIGWRPSVDPQSGVAAMIEWTREGAGAR